MKLLSGSPRMPGRGSGSSKATRLSTSTLSIPSCRTISAAVLKQNSGDLKPLAELAKRAPAAAKRPLAGISYALPIAHPGKIVCLGLNYLDHVKEGPNANNIPKFPTLFNARAQLPWWPTIIR